MVNMIRKSIFVTTIIFFAAAVGASAQFRAIPAAVTNTFAFKYPGAGNVEWKDKVTDFEAKFSLKDSATLAARFKKSGEWENTVEQISGDHLPAAVKNGLSVGEFSAWPITSAYILYSPNSKKEYHVTVAKNDVDKRNLLFNSHGKLLRDKVAL
jgi:hypothetical protein